MGTLGATETIIATEICNAVAADETPENGGCDLSAGMFGPALSQWVRDTAKHIDDLTTSNRQLTDAAEAMAKVLNSAHPGINYLTTGHVNEATWREWAQSARNVVAAYRVVAGG